jgi:Tol biopolymer transport system component
MTLPAGQTLSFYAILGPLGAGAMGEVYRARDTRLGREVALKVLPERFADDEERLRRFEREAQALAALQHPNIAAIFGIDQVEGTCFMAMELVPGEDLAARLARGALPVADALDVCRQVAEGLEAAHEAGVFHRDLKPANVIVTPHGTAKVLDFGLAKPCSAAAEPGSSTDAVFSTEAGRVLGTPTYMAPEQARGKPVDKRVDLWAFGCVLFECLTGRRTFAGETVSDVLAAVLEREPDWSRLPAATPAHVRALLGRCLEKDPRMRLRDAGEARVALARGAASPAGAERSRGSRSALVAAIALVLGGAGLWAGSWLTESSAGPTRIVQRRLTEIVGLEEMPAVSPDGGKVAFLSRVNGRRQVFLRSLATGTWKQLTQGDVDHSFPRWADANWLVYFQEPDGEEPGSLWEREYLAASPPRLLLRSAQGEADGDHAGKRIATFRIDDEGPALVVGDRHGVENGTAYRLPPAAYRSPRWSPRDDRIAFEAMASLSSTELRLLDLRTGRTETVRTVAGQMRGIAWLPDGSGLVYSSSEGSTLPYPPIFCLRTVGLADGFDAPLPYEGAGYASYVEPDVTAKGELVVSRVAMESDVFRYPVEGTAAERAALTLRITHQTGQVQVPSVSPDGAEVAYLSDSGGHGNIWIARVAGEENPRQITHEEDPLTILGLPIWSPRGDWITYWRGPPGAPAEQWLVRPDGTEPRLLVQVRGAASWSRDGEWLFYMIAGCDPGDPSIEKTSVDTGETVPVRQGANCMLVTSDGTTGFFARSDYLQGQIWKAAPLESGTPELICDLQSRLPMWPHIFALGPDDRWLATPLRDRGTTNLWLVSTADGALRQVTDFGQRATTIGRQLSWSSDGRYLFAALLESDADIVLLEGALP